MRLFAWSVDLPRFSQGLPERIILFYLGDLDPASCYRRKTEFLSEPTDLLHRRIQHGDLGIRVHEIHAGLIQHPVG